jgi:hypothetical protein
MKSAAGGLLASDNNNLSEKIHIVHPFTGPTKILQTNSPGMQKPDFPFEPNKSLSFSTFENIHSRNLFLTTCYSRELAQRTNSISLKIPTGISLEWRIISLKK